ncbi:hypothetical protein [Paenibacillus sp. GYB003]|uniref:hypothetical protein n=1 Tax=Paenibacillus sp. GYB003 TaxID=2994392 RepID=UPI002F96BDE2
MTPDQIQEGKCYIGHNGGIYEVLFIQQSKGQKWVRFIKRGPEGGNGRWPIKQFAPHMREEMK